MGGFIDRDLYNRIILLPLLLLVFCFLVSSAWGSTSNIIEVSQPVQVTDNAYYERGQSIIYDGENYWLFYARSDSVTGNYGNSNPDTPVSYTHLTLPTKA